MRHSNNRYSLQYSYFYRNMLLIFTLAMVPAVSYTNILEK